MNIEHLSSEQDTLDVRREPTAWKCKLLCFVKAATRLVRLCNAYKNTRPTAVLRFQGHRAQQANPIALQYGSKNYKPLEGMTNDQSLALKRKARCCGMLSSQLRPKVVYTAIV